MFGFLDGCTFGRFNPYVRLREHSVLELALASVLLLVVMFFCVTTPAAAATAALPAPVDFSPIVNDLIGLLAAVLTAATPFVVLFVVSWLRSKNMLVSAQQQQVVANGIDGLMTKAIGYGQSAAEHANADHLTAVQISNPIVAKAASYAIVQAPTLLKAAGYDVTTADGQKAVVRMVTARLGIPAPDTTSAVTVKTT